VHTSINLDCGSFIVCFIIVGIDKMAKRQANNVEEGIRAKTLRLGDNLELPSDKMFDEWEAENLKTNLTYDNVFDQFMVRLTTKTKDGQLRSINVEELDANRLLAKLKTVTAVAKKYEKVPAPKPLDISIELEMIEISKTGVVIGLKENQYKRGDMSIDIRRCLKMRDGTLSYTKEGVRMPVSMGIILKEKLEQYDIKIMDAVKGTSRVLKMSKLATIMKGMKELGNPPCYGCEVDHPSQIQHMETGGCLSTEPQLTWVETVEEFFEIVLANVERERLVEIGAKVCARPGIEEDLCLSAVHPVIESLEQDLRAICLKRTHLNLTNCFVCAWRSLTRNERLAGV
jgi:hypothetical protein